MITSVKLTVLFKEPFWVGVFEIEERGVYKVSKVTFGAEPKDGEVLELILKMYYKLNFLAVKVADEKVIKKKENPKRNQREISKQLRSNTIGTKSQIALSKAYEENKVVRKQIKKEKKEEEKERQFEIKQMKKKEKHKGH